MTNETTAAPQSRNLPMALGGGAIIGALGGLIGLGGAEFRLPLLIGLFEFRGSGSRHSQQGPEPRRGRDSAAVPRRNGAFRRDR